jgi:hypothetical protein
MSKLKFGTGNLDHIANYFYLRGYIVGRVKEVVPSNFDPDDSFQDQKVVGLSINRNFGYGYSSEVLILSSGVAYIHTDTGNGINNFKGAYPKDLDSALKVIEELIKIQKEM